VRKSAFIIPLLVGGFVFLTFSAPALGEDEDFYAYLSVG
jgi:hypothetical protein